MAKIFVDGAEYEVEDGANLLHAVLSESLDLPYFCWHPSMGSIGACRQCAVIEYRGAEDERGKISMACMTSVSDGMRISIEAPHAKNFRASVIEWLMTNHPHDCPVCEEGGECHLQDMTVMTGHATRVYNGLKRTWQNQDLGPFIGHEMNRCITCYRCVRFYKDYAGGADLDAFGSRGRMYFGRVDDGTLESEFAGNLVEVCPTGVFTDKPFAKNYTRKWDLQSAPSICPGCSVGCNIFASERYGELRRIHNRYHNEVNQYFLCDRGRFGSHFVNADVRIKNSAVKAADGAFEVRGGEAAVNAAAKLLKGEFIGIGSPRASVEANFALKQLVGESNFCTGMSDSEQRSVQAILSNYQQGGFTVPTIAAVESADVVLVLGEDISNTAARVALAVRQATRGVSLDMASQAGIPQWQDSGVRGHAQHNTNPIFVASSSSTRLDDIATATYDETPESIAQMGSQIASAIRGEAVGPDDNDFLKQTATALGSAKRPLVISGCGVGDATVIEAAADIARALSDSSDESLFLGVGLEANSFGAALVDGELTMSGALARMQSGAAAVVLENDLNRRASEDQVKLAVDGSAGVVALDLYEYASLESSQVIFPAASYVEQTGTYVNCETRAQRFYEVFEPKNEIQASWLWVTRLGRALGRDDCQWQAIDELSAACAQAASLQGMRGMSPGRDYRFAGIQRIPRQSHRYSGRTAMRANVNVHEPKATVDTETPFSYSMEGQNPGDQDGAVVPYVWSPGWNSNQSVFKFQQEVGGELLGGDPGVRLLEVSSQPATSNGKSDLPSEAPQIKNGNLRYLPVYDVFSSDELSNHSWPISTRALGPFALLNPTDAKSLEVESGDGVACDQVMQGSMEVIVDTRVPVGAVGICQGTIKNRFYEGTGISLMKDAGFQNKAARAARVIAKG